MSPEAPLRERPRLLIVSPSAYPFGGVASWLDGLVDGLRRRGWPLELALLAGRHHDVDRYLERHPLGAVRRVANPSGSREGRQRALVDAIRESRAELVLSINVGDIEEAVDRLRRSGRTEPRLVTAQHGLQRDFYDHLRSRSGSVDGVIVTNRLGVELARLYSGMAAERTAYAPCGVELDSTAPRPPRRGALRIVWAGRLEEPQKRVGDLPGICRELDAAAMEYRLDVAGSGPEFSRLEAALAPWMDGGRVRLLGEVSRRNLCEEVFTNNDVLLVTSSWETGPIVAWEALAAGMAVVTSRYLGSGLEGALRHEETALLFPVGDTEAAAAALRRISNLDVLERLTVAGRTEVERRYTLRASLDAWETALERIALLPTRPPNARTLSIAHQGRLDRWLGVRLAESVRRSFCIEHEQQSPGAEWPHALARSGDESEFRDLAWKLDRPVAISVEASA